MGTHNSVTLLGRLGRDPEMFDFGNGLTMARLKIATQDNFRNKEGKLTTTTDWHTVVLWRGQADLAGQYLRKGMQVFINGKLRNRKTRGTDNWNVYVEGLEVTLLDKFVPDPVNTAITDGETPQKKENGTKDEPF